jgi:tRNA G46 methylase TrmB
LLIIAVTCVIVLTIMAAVALGGIALLNPDPWRKLIHQLVETVA